MLVKRKLNSRHTQAGVTLVELMISIVLGLLLLGAATAMTVSSMVMNGDTLMSARLNQDLDSVLQIMVNDIRRAGYTGGGAVLKANGVVVEFEDNEDLYIDSDNSCVLYAYDADENGVLDDTDKFGFKRVEVSTNPVVYEIEMRTSCDAGDDCANDCGDEVGEWVALTDSGVISITNLAFDTTNSKCLNITHTDNIKEGNRNNFWVTTADGATKFSCLEDDTDKLANYTLDVSGAYISGDFESPATGDRLIGVRQVNIEMVVKDLDTELEDDYLEIKRQLVAVNVRNNRVSTL